MAEFFYVKILLLGMEKQDTLFKVAIGRTATIFIILAVSGVASFV
jgi:hypothetical protein